MYRLKNGRRRSLQPFDMINRRVLHFSSLTAMKRIFGKAHHFERILVKLFLVINNLAHVFPLTVLNITDAAH